jgi:hypothetical protein
MYLTTLIHIVKSLKNDSGLVLFLIIGVGVLRLFTIRGADSSLLSLSKIEWVLKVIIYEEIRKFS